MPQLKQKAGYNQEASPNRLQPALFLNVLIEMQNNGKSDYTIKFTKKSLTFLGKHANLNEPEAVKHFIATLRNKKGEKISNSYKRNLCIAYNRYCKYYKIQLEMPKYKAEQVEHVPPTKEKVLMLIAAASRIQSLKLKISVETGLRPIELCRLRARDANTEQKLITPKTAKNGNSRTLPITPSLAASIQEYIIRKNLKPDDKLFCGSADDYGKHFRAMRNKLAEKLKDPSIRTIRLYDLRHYFCTKKLYDTGNPYTVMRLMGHKKIETTQKYMHYLNLNEDEWDCEGATTAKEAMKLVEAGWNYVTTIEGIQLFKKRK